MAITLNGTTGISLPNGSASAPAATGTDTDTGIVYGTNTVQVATGGTTAVTVDSSQQVGIGTASPAYPLDVAGAMRSNSWIGRTNVSAPTADAAMYRAADNTLAFSTANTERMRIDSSGNLLVNTTSNITGTGGKVALKFDGGASWGMAIQTTYGGGTGSRYMQFVNSAGSETGNINQNGTTTVAYSTSSDYRLKENIAPMTGALARVSALKPVTYTWKVDGSDGQGFIAHELQEVCPDAVVGEKDAVETYIDEDGNQQTRIKPQSIDTSFLVATLTAAIQELKAIVDAQAERISVLENNNVGN